MKSVLTLAELKRRGDEAFTEAQAAIDTALQIAKDSRQFREELRESIADFKRGQERSRRREFA